MNLEKNSFTAKVLNVFNYLQHNFLTALKYKKPSTF